MARGIPGRRVTLDADFLAKYDNSKAKIKWMVRRICSLKAVDDGINFKQDTVAADKITGDAEYAGVRIKVTAFMERTRIPVQIDFGFGDVIYPRAENIKYPVILDLPAARLKGYPPESVLSEKFEAIVSLGDLNSRMKDFYDIWLIFRCLKLNEIKTATAIKKTFKNRKTNMPRGSRLFSADIYDSSSDRQRLWKAFLTKNGIKNAPELLSGAARSIEKELLKYVELIRKEPHG